MFNEMPLDQAMQMYGQQPQVMAGTKTPEQMAQDRQQTAIVDALRGISQPQGVAPAQAGRVVSSGALGDGMDAKLIGGSLSDLFGGSGYSAPADLAGTSFI